MKRIYILSVLLGLVLFSGCSGLDAQELYCLPEAPKTYYELQEALSAELSAGLSYHAPASGSRREPVQLVDLNGDGVDEAVAFFRTDDGAVKTYIFANHDGTYEKDAVIDCAGSAVASVEYADLTGTGDLELLISCQVSEAVTQALQVCRYAPGEATTIATVPCNRTELTDLDGDGARELFCFVDNGSDACSLGFYRFREGNLQLEREFRLSSAYSNILEVKTLTLTDGAYGLSVTLSYGDSQTAYDVFAMQEDALTALAPTGELLLSQNLKGGTLYPQDMDEDGLLEFPKAEPMRAYGEGTAPQSLVLWYGLDSAGKGKQKAVTYHDLGNQWYLTLPEAWVGNVLAKENTTASALSTVTTVTFYRTGKSGAVGDELLTIYTLKGANRQTLAEEQKLSILYSDTEVTYAFSLPETVEKWDGNLSMSQLSDGFHMIKG